MLPLDGANSRALTAWLAMPAEHATDFDTVARAIAILLEVPVVLISTLDDDRHIFVGTYGVSHEAGDDVSPLCLEVVTLKRPVLMQDARRHLPASIRDDCGTALVSCMGLPITGRDGTCSGAVSVFRKEDRSWQDRDLVVLRGFNELLAELLAERRQRRELPSELHAASLGPESSL